MLIPSSGVRKALILSSGEISAANEDEGTIRHPLRRDARGRHNGFAFSIVIG